MHARRHVSMLSLHYPPELTGNAPYVGALATGLSHCGLEVDAHVGHPHYPEWRVRPGYGQWTSTETSNGVRVTRRRHYVPRPPRGIRRLASELSFGVRLIGARWGSPDLVLALSPALFSTAIATLRVRLGWRRPPIIVWVQDLYSLGIDETGEGNRIVAHVTRWVESRSLRAAYRVVVIHPRFAEFVTGELGVDPARVTVIRNWTHLPAPPVLDGATSRSALGWPSDLTVAVHTGNMGAKQGLENLVDAAVLADAIDAPVQFILVGDGGERAALQIRAAGVKHITFVDPLDEDDYHRALAAADVLLVNEKTGVSSMAVPSKLTSYFDAARPIIAATDPGGTTASEIDASGAGIVVAAGDPAALLRAVMGLRGDSATSQLLGGRGRLYRERVLDARSAIEAFRNLIDSTLENRRLPTH